MRKLVSGLEFAAYSIDREVRASGKVYPTKKSIDSRLAEIRTKFKDHLISYSSWTSCFIFCEFLNLANVIFQIILTNIFLGGQFLPLGIKIMKKGLDTQVDILDVVFPKMTKCTFYKYGPSGTVQAHDALCVMALNVINEKIFAFLWFWFAILLVVSVGALVWRFLTFLLYNVSVGFNKMVFAPGGVHDSDVRVIMEKCSYNDWLFLAYLSSNMDFVVFKNFFEKLADEFDEDLLLNDPSDSKTLLKSE